LDRSRQWNRGRQAVLVVSNPFRAGHWIVEVQSATFGA